MSRAQRTHDRSKSAKLTPYRSQLLEHLPRPAYRWKWTDVEGAVDAKILNWLRENGHVEQVRQGWWRTTEEIAEYIEGLFGEELACEDGVPALDGEPGEYDPHGEYVDPSTEMQDQKQLTLTDDEHSLPPAIWCPVHPDNLDNPHAEAGRRGAEKKHRDPGDIPDGQVTIDDLTDPSSDDSGEE